MTRSFPATIVSLCAVCLVFCLLAAGGCGDDPVTCAPYAVGAVSGTVREAGSPLSVAVGLRALAGDQAGRVVALTESDSTGRYRLEAPSGPYVLEIDPNVNATVWRAENDTLRLASEVVHRDISLGRIEVRLQVPAELEGDSYRLTAYGDSPGNPNATAQVSGGQLQFTLGRLVPGDYALGLRSPSLSEVFLPDAPSRDEATPHRVPAERVLEIATDLRPLHGSIAGRVTGSLLAQGLADEVMVRAVDAQRASLGYVHCDEEGRFRIDLYAVTTSVRLHSDYDLSFVQWFGGPDEADADVYAVAPGTQVRDVELVESGLVLDLVGPGGNPIERVTVTVRAESGVTATREYYSGPSPIGNLAPGRYYVRVDGDCSEETWAPQWYGGGDDPATATPIDLGTGELRGVTINLDEGGRITGEARDATGGVPLHGTYSLHAVDGDVLCVRQSTFSGRMLFTGLADGTYLVAAVLPGASPWFYPGTSDLAAATPLAIVDHAPLDDLVWTLSAPTPEVAP